MRDDRRNPAEDTPVKECIESGLEIIFGCSDPHQAEQLTRLVMLLAQWAPRMNLTGHRDPIEMTSRLVLDAAALVAALPELDGLEDLADLGSGAGFPGLPIAILRPHLAVYLVESREKRHHFQREARRQLKLDRVIPVLGRSDEVEVRACGGVVAQAMAHPDQALASMRPWAREGGLLILPASESAEPPQVSDIAIHLERRSYAVPFTNVHRQIWLARLAPAVL